MSKEIPLQLIVDAVAGEKGINQSFVIDAIEAALVSATKKKHGANIDVKIIINHEENTYDTFRIWTIVEDPEPGTSLEFPLSEISLSAAKIDNPKFVIENILRQGVEL